VPALHRIAREAGKAILAIYHGNEEITANIKKDDSPVTAADLAAHRIIEDGLTALWPEIPVLSEEAAEDFDWSRRRQWSQYWLVDPLDGTKEFIKKNGEFTVNIALIHKNLPVLGVIHAPVFHETFWAAQGQGAYFESKEQTATLMSAAEFSFGQEHLKVVGSRSHSNPKTAEYLSRFNSYEMYSMGSSLKFMLLAKGEAHLYPRTGPTMEWDTAAAHIILREAGGEIIRFDTGEVLTYNKENLLNPEFLAFGKKLDR